MFHVKQFLNKLNINNMTNLRFLTQAQSINLGKLLFDVVTTLDNSTTSTYKVSMINNSLIILNKRTLVFNFDDKETINLFYCFLRTLELTGTITSKEYNLITTKFSDFKNYNNTF